MILTGSQTEGPGTQESDMQPTVLFRESQAWWMNPLLRVVMPLESVVLSVLLLALAARAAPGDRAVLLAVWFGLCVVLPVGFLSWRLVTEVTPTTLHAGFPGTLRWRIPLDQVQTAVPARVDPLRDFGGWGWRSSRKFGRVLNVAGRDAVVITTLDGRVRTLGTQRPEDLAVAVLRGAMGEAGTPKNGC